MQSGRIRTTVLPFLDPNQTGSHGQWKSSCPQATHSRKPGSYQRGRVYVRTVKVLSILPIFSLNLFDIWASVCRSNPIQLL